MTITTLPPGRHRSRGVGACRTRARLGVVVAVVLTLLAVLVGLATGGAQAAPGDRPTLYVDCGAAGGGDGSQGSPWQNPSAIPELATGTAVLLRRGCSWDVDAGVTLKGGDELLLGAYGDGAAPIITAPKADRERGAVLVESPRATVTGLHIKTTPGPGVTLAGVGALAEDLWIEDTAFGVRFTGDGTRVNRVAARNLHLFTNTPKSVNPDDDSGAVAFNVEANNVTVENSSCVYCRAPSADYGYDGGFIELWRKGSGLKAYNNVSYETQGWIETGGVKDKGDRIDGVELVGNKAAQVYERFWYANPMDEGQYGIPVTGVKISGNIVALAEGAGAITGQTEGVTDDGTNRIGQDVPEPVADPRPLQQQDDGGQQPADQPHRGGTTPSRSDPGPAQQTGQPPSGRPSTDGPADGRAPPQLSSSSATTSANSSTSPSPAEPSSSSPDTPQTGSSPAGDGQQRITAYVSAYDYYDNTPPGSATVSHPQRGGTTASGDGRYENPVTIAVGHVLQNGQDLLDHPPGTRFYFPRLRVYGIVEDTCGDGPTPQNGPCHQHPADTETWLDVWIDGRDTDENTAAGRMDAATGRQDVIKDPPPGLPVHDGPIAAQTYDDALPAAASTGDTASPSNGHAAPPAAPPTASQTATASETETASEPSPSTDAAEPSGEPAAHSGQAAAGLGMLIASETGPTSPDWKVTSGSLFWDPKENAWWTGQPAGTAGAPPSAVFRAVTTPKFGDATTSLRYRIDEITSTPATPETPWDGLHIFLRYQTEEQLYYATVGRRDGLGVIKKKCKGGPSNGGTYYDLASQGGLGRITLGQWVEASASSRVNQDGSVTLTLTRDGQTLTATDTGVGCAVYTAEGHTGLRVDNSDLRFTDFQVGPPRAS